MYTSSPSGFPNTSSSSLAGRLQGQMSSPSAARSIAAVCSVSPTSVTRLATALGSDSFRDFKFNGT